MEPCYIWLSFLIARSHTHPPQFGQAKTSRRIFLRSSMTPCSSSVWITLPLSSRSKRTMSQRCSFSLRKRSQILLACIVFRSKPEMLSGNVKRSLLNRNPSRVLDIDCFIIVVSRENWIRNWELRLYLVTAPEKLLLLKVFSGLSIDYYVEESHEHFS